MTQVLDDPVDQLERELVGAARRRAAQRRQARLLRWAVAPAALILIALAVVLLSGSRPSSSLAAALYTHLSPGRGLIHLEYETHWYSGGKLYERALGETWYTTRTEHSIGTNESVHGGHFRRYLEVVRHGRTLISFESGARTLTTQSTCPHRSRFPSARQIDPISDFDFLYKHGRISERGTTEFDGRRVAQLVAVEHDNEFTYLVDRDSAEPVAMRVTPRVTARLQTATHFTGTVVRFSAHNWLPLNKVNRKLLAMRPHPGARLVHLGTRFCRRRP